MTPSIRLSLLPWLALVPWLLFTPAAVDAAPGGPALKPNKLAAPAAVEVPPPSSMSFSVVNAAGRFDLSVNNAPAAQVYLQLGYDTPYNVLVAPEVTGTISIALKNTNVLEAMESLRELYGYEYRVTGNRIFVQPNGVQTRLFKVNYLPGRRQGASDIHVTSSAITQPGSGSTTSTSTSASGSSSPANSGGRTDDSAHVRTTSDADFWREVQASLTALVGNANQRSVVMNPAAGVIVVRATAAEQRQVEAYLNAVQLSIERQVMLEAKIIDVELNQDAQSGVNWAAFGSVGGGKLSAGVGAPGATIGNTGTLGDGVNSAVAGASVAAGALGRGFYGLAFQAANFASLINFLQTQGNVSVLSSPRIATINNQKAVLKVGSDELFVTGVSTTTSSTASGTGGTSSPSLTLQPFFSGIALDVTPQIDDVGHVMLHVHPSISTVREKQKIIDLGTLGAYRLPLATSTINETDSIVRLRDGQIAAIGGLMLQETRDERTGLPVLSEAPVIGGLFRQKSTVTRKREVVILIKPTVIRDDAAWPEPDAKPAAISLPAAGS